jgi:hypothetical protein
MIDWILFLLARMRMALASLFVLPRRQEQHTTGSTDTPEYMGSYDSPMTLAERVTLPMPDLPISPGTLVEVGAEAQPLVEPGEPLVVEPTEQKLPAQEASDREVTMTATTARKRIAPSKRGGRSRTARSPERKSKQEREESVRIKPEIICFNRERRWIVAVEISAGLSQASGLTVLQNGSPLEEEHSREACWRLKQLSGQIVVRWNGEKDEVSLGQEDYLLFKLTRDQKEGRHIKSASSGSYLVIVPDSWKRDETLSGPPPAAPEPVAFAARRAHFFDLDKGEAIAFQSLDGAVRRIASKAQRFELVRKAMARDDGVWTFLLLVRALNSLYRLKSGRGKAGGTFSGSTMRTMIS